MKKWIVPFVGLVFVASGGQESQAEIAHDAEHYILLDQKQDEWAADDAVVDAELQEFQTRTGKVAPNIVYILIDDMGFGDMGIPELNKLRGYETKNINDLAKQSMRFARMYTEPSCTPTRVAFMTGRQPYRNGMAETAVDISGFGLAAKEETLAEVLKKAGYNTSHVGKWHMGDIRESWPNNQGFDYAAFPIHQQGQLAIFQDDAADEGISIGIGKNNYDDRFTVDEYFRPDASAMVTGVENHDVDGNLIDAGNVMEVHMTEGERWNQAKYDAMNDRYQSQTLEQLQLLKDAGEPFFLQYWPLIPLSTPRTTVDQFTTPNGGTFVESMQQLDGWIGEILSKINELEIADETLVIVMGDNGHFTKYSPESGYTPMIFRGGKGDTSEGGVRVDAFARWPGMISPSIVGDTIHVADLFTTIARFAGATQYIPTDRIIDGVDQSALMLEGELHGRRDYVFIYSGNSLKAVVKEHIKFNVPGAGENPIGAPYYDLYRDTREEYSVSTEIGSWAGGEFTRMIERHEERKGKYSYDGGVFPATGVPYDGVINQRQETIDAVDAFLTKQAAPYYPDDSANSE